jgi:hypothetical protein
MTAVLAFRDAVDIGGGRGRLAAPAAASLARVDAEFRSAFGRAADINEAWRSPQQADANFAAYQAYLNGGPWAPIGLAAKDSIHCRGYAVDTDDTSTAQMRIWNDHGWFWTVYRNGVLVERWHLEYNASRDNHRGEGTPASDNASPFKEDDMPLNQDDLVKILTAQFKVTQRGQSRMVSIAQALEAVFIVGDIISDRLNSVPTDVWGHRLEHPIAGADGKPFTVPAGDFLRYEPAEHANTRAAVALVATGDIDYEQIADEIAEKYPQLDPHAFAVAAADEADRRERKALEERERERLEA